VRVVVKATADVPGRTFTLGEIADITGADKALTAQVSSTEVGTSPLPGLNRGITSFDIITRLRFNRIDTKQVDISCPPSVKVTRGGAEASAAEIVQAATASLEAARKGSDDNATFEPAPLIARLFVPAGKCVYQAGAPRGQVRGGAATVPVTILVDGNPVKTIEVAFRIKRMGTAVVAKRMLTAHTVLTADDLSVTSVEVQQGMTAPVTSIDSILGKRTTRAVNQGAIITASSVEMAPVVASGAKVTVEVSIGGVRISAPAIARTPGAVGEKIRVMAMDTHKELVGTVVDAQTVRVEEIQ